MVAPIAFYLAMIVFHTQHEPEQLSLSDATNVSGLKVDETCRNELPHAATS